MKHFSDELDRIKREKNLSASDIAGITKISNALFSRVKSGVRNITFGELDKLALAFPRQPLIHARLLRARLMDELHHPGGHLISIDIVGQSPTAMSDASPPYRTKSEMALPSQLDKATRKFNAAWSNDPGLRQMITYLADRLPEA